MALQKLAAMWTALLAMGLLIALLTYRGRRERQRWTLAWATALLFGLNLALICGVFGALALLISQFTQERRTAAGITGGLLLVFIVLDMVHRVIPGTEWLSRLSPVYYYNLSKPLMPSYGANAGALLVLAAPERALERRGDLALCAARCRRARSRCPRWLRVPERAVSPERALPVNAWSLRSVYARSLAMIAVPTLWWTLAIAGFAALMVFIVAADGAETAVALYELAAAAERDSPTLAAADANTNAALLSFLFVLLPVLLMAFAVTQASRWSADEEDGLQELVLATPQPRLTRLLARFGALTTATVFIGVLTLAADGAGRRRHRSGAGRGQSGRGHAFDDSAGAADGGAGLSVLRLAARRRRHRPLELPAGDLVLHQLHRAGAELAGRGAAALGPLLLWHAAAARLAGGYTLTVLPVAIGALALASARFVRKDIAR